MSQSTLTLTEKAVKNHCKRLKKELSNYNLELPLTNVQHIFSKALGFNHFYELKIVLDNNIEKKHYHSFSFSINEKFVFVCCMLIINNQHNLMKHFIDNYYIEGINEFLINTLFDKYINEFNNSNFLMEYQSKEIVLLKVIDLARKKQILPCAYFVWLKTEDPSLWNLLFLSGRSLSLIKQKNAKIFDLFQQYKLTTV